MFYCYHVPGCEDWIERLFVILTFALRYWWMCNQTEQLHKGPNVCQHARWFPVSPCGLPKNPSCYICEDITHVSLPFHFWHPTTSAGQLFIAHIPLFPTSRCERNPCPVDNRACSQAPNSFSYHYLAVVSNLSAPRVMFTVSALRLIGDTLRFSLLGGQQARRHFTVQRSDRVTGELMLVRPVQGPATLEAEVEMTELERRGQLGRYITKVTMFVSQYDF